MPHPPPPTSISPNICRACITLIDRTAHPTCDTSGPNHPCAACTLRGSSCEPVPASLQLQLTDLIYFHARWRTACAGIDKAIATRTKKELTANVMDFIELLDEDKAGKAGGEAEAETEILVPAVPAKPASAAIKTTKAVPASATAQAGKKRANADDSQAGGPVKRPKPSTARVPKPKTPAPPKQVMSKASSPEKVDKAQKAQRSASKSTSPVPRHKQALPVTQSTGHNQNQKQSATVSATTTMHATPPRDNRTSYPLSTPEIAATGRTELVSDPSSCDTSLTASTLPHPAMFTSEYLNFDFDFDSGHPHPQTQSQVPLSSSDTSTSFHSAQQLGPAFTHDGIIGAGHAIDAIHTNTLDMNMSNLKTNAESSSRGGSHDVSVQILEQLRTMNATLGGMYDLMKYQAQAQAQMSSAPNGGQFQG